MNTTSTVSPSLPFHPISAVTQSRPASRNLVLLCRREQLLYNGHARHHFRLNGDVYYEGHWRDGFPEGQGSFVVCFPEQELQAPVPRLRKPREAGKASTTAAAATVRPLAPLQSPVVVGPPDSCISGAGGLREERRQPEADDLDADRVSPPALSCTSPSTHATISTASEESVPALSSKKKQNVPLLYRNRRVLLRYDGEFVAGRFHGEGRYVTHNGSRHVGRYSEGVKSGMGVKVFANGDKYNGNYEDGEKHGLGLYVFAQLNAMYRGEFYKGLFHGLGTYFYPPNSRASSCFRSVRLALLASAQCPVSSPSTTKTANDATEQSLLYIERYEGQWRRGKKHGAGTFFFNTGDRLVGTWKKGVEHGDTMYYMCVPSPCPAAAEPRSSSVSSTSGVDSNKPEPSTCLSKALRFNMGVVEGLHPTLPPPPAVGDRLAASDPRRTETHDTLNEDKEQTAWFLVEDDELCFGAQDTDSMTVPLGEISHLPYQLRSEMSVFVHSIPLVSPNSGSSKSFSLSASDLSSAVRASTPSSFDDHEVVSASAATFAFASAFSKHLFTILVMSTAVERLTADSLRKLHLSGTSVSVPLSVLVARHHSIDALQSMFGQLARRYSFLFVEPDGGSGDLCESPVPVTPPSIVANPSSNSFTQTLRRSSLLSFFFDRPLQSEPALSRSGTAPHSLPRFSPIPRPKPVSALPNVYFLGCLFFAPSSDQRIAVSSLLHSEDEADSDEANIIVRYDALRELARVAADSVRLELENVRHANRKLRSECMDVTGNLQSVDDAVARETLSPARITPPPLFITEVDEASVVAISEARVGAFALARRVAEKLLVEARAWDANPHNLGGVVLDDPAHTMTLLRKMLVDMSLSELVSGSESVASCGYSGVSK